MLFIQFRAPLNELKEIQTLTVFLHHHLEEVLILIRLQKLGRWTHETKSNLWLRVHKTKHNMFTLWLEGFVKYSNVVS